MASCETPSITYEVKGGGGVRGVGRGADEGGWAVQGGEWVGVGRMRVISL